jgi:hypothetical protein
MRVRVEKVTPKRAQEWIDRSHDVHQRGLAKNRVEKMVHAIHAGQWQLTHQPIAIDPTGRVFDGQHRLHAIVIAGQDMPDLTVELLVAWDAEPASFDVIDTGAARTPADTLRIAGFTNTNVLAAAIRSVLTYDQIAGTTRPWGGVAKMITSADTLAWIMAKGNRDKATAALQISGRVSTAVGKHGTNSAIAAAALIMMTRGEDTAVGSDTMYEFFERLSDGALLASHSPILALRRWLIGDTGFSRVVAAYRRPTAVAAIIKAMNDYLVDRERSVIVYKIGIEPMPELLTKTERDEVLIARERALEAREKIDA